MSDAKEPEPVSPACGSAEYLAAHQQQMLATVPDPIPTGLPMAWLLRATYYVRIALLHPDAKQPVYARAGDSGFDLLTLTDVTILPGAVAKIPLGLAFEIPEGLEIQVRSRSGLSSKLVTVANSPGTVDSGYRGEVAVLLHNQGSADYTAAAGDKIAQGVLVPVFKAVFVEMPIEDLSATDRGAGGFNSTGA